MQGEIFDEEDILSPEYESTIKIKISSPRNNMISAQSFTRNSNKYIPHDESKYSKSKNTTEESKNDYYSISLQKFIIFQQLKNNLRQAFNLENK